MSRIFLIRCDTCGKEVGSDLNWCHVRLTDPNTIIPEDADFCSRSCRNLWLLRQTSDVQDAT